MRLQSPAFACVTGIVCAVLAGCGLRKDGGRPAGTVAPARPVQLVAVQTRPMERAITVSGTLAAHEQSTLSAKVPGRLQRLSVDLGSVVRSNEVVAQVDPRDYELRVQQAVAALAQARADLGLPIEGDDDSLTAETVSAVRQARAVLEEADKSRQRVESLSRSGIASDSERDTTEAAYKVARTRYEAAIEQVQTRMAALSQRRAELAIAQKQLADASVRAPFDGAVQARPATVGEYVAAGVPIVRLVKTDPLRLRLEVPERLAGMVRTGQVVQVLAEGIANTPLGRIARVSPALTEDNRMLVVEADVPNGDDRLRAGVFVSARIIVNEREEGLAIPAGALTTFAGIEKVVTIKDDKAVERTVTTGRRSADWVEILSGLSVGERVVADPVGLRTGQAVTVTAEAAPTTAGTAANH